MPTGDSALVPHPFLIKSLEPLVGLLLNVFIIISLLSIYVNYPLSVCNNNLNNSDLLQRKVIIINPLQSHKNKT